MKKGLIISAFLITLLLMPIGVYAFNIPPDKTITGLYANSLNNVDSIQNDSQLSDMDKIKKLVIKLFDTKSEGYKLEETQNYDLFFDTSNEESKNLKYFADKAHFDIETKKQAKIKILWDKTNTDFLDLEVKENSANVTAYVSYEYQMEDSPKPTFVGTMYTIDINKIKNKWLITKIISNDAFDQAYSESSINLETMLYSNNKDVKEAEDLIKEKQDLVKKNVQAAVLSGYTDIPYDRNLAVEYATNYASYITRNLNFWYYNDTTKNESDCQCYASQCVWAGFGGVATDSYSINQKLFPMCNQEKSGPRSWYQTATRYDTPINYSWTSCTNFANYLAAGGYDVGPYGYEFQGVAYSHLGDIIHIKWASNGRRHAVVVVGFKSGSVYGSRTRDQIYVSAHTGDCNNELLTSIAGTTGNTLYTQVIGGNLK